MEGPDAPALDTARPLAFVDDIGTPRLSDVDRHHFERVLRVRAGEPITVSGGNGSWRDCSFGPVIVPRGEPVWVPRPMPTLTVGFAIPKGDRAEWAVQKLTEVGVDRIVLLHAERSVVRWDAARAVRHVERLRRVAREAAMQSRRCWLPQVNGPIDVVDAAPPGTAARCELGGSAPTLEHAVLLVGPEGGWSDGERAGIVHTVALGPHMLRVETAAFCAGALLTALRSGLVAQTPIVANDAVRG
jgi:16S rRNA (uracil1498-N3)-methyltransferase